MSHFIEMISIITFKALLMEVLYLKSILRYDLPNGFTYLQLGRDFINLFSSPEHKVLRVSYCDRPLSVVRRRPSSVNFFT